MIGLIPAAGQATRIRGLPKMLLPTPQGELLDVLIRRMVAANVKETMIGINPVFHSFLQAHGYGKLYPVVTQTMTETVQYLWDQAMSDQSTVLFGMPDTYFEDEQAFVKLVAALDDGADVAVGLFKARPDQHPKAGMCRTAGDHVTTVVDKPAVTDLTWLWGVLAWRPIFWQHFKTSQPHVGYALNPAIQAKLDVRAVKLDGGYWDCGTADEYFALVRHLTAERVQT